MGGVGRGEIAVAVRTRIKRCAGLRCGSEIGVGVGVGRSRRRAIEGVVGELGGEKVPLAGGAHHLAQGTLRIAVGLHLVGEQRDAACALGFCVQAPDVLGEVEGPHDQCAVRAVHVVGRGQRGALLAVRVALLGGLGEALLADGAEEVLRAATLVHHQRALLDVHVAAVALDEARLQGQIGLGTLEVPPALLSGRAESMSG